MLHSIGPVTTCFWHIMACLMHRNCSQMGLTMVLACRMSFINTLRPRQDGRHFPDDIFKWIFLNGNVWIAIKISLKFVPKGSVNNIPPLVQVMAWRRPGDKPLFEPMMVNLLTHMCVTRPQWVKVSFTPDLLPRPILQQANPLFQYHSGQDIMTTKSWSMASWGITLSPLPDYCPPPMVSNASVMCFYLSLLLAWASCWANNMVPVIWDVMTLMWRHCKVLHCKSKSKSKKILFIVGTL